MSATKYFKVPGKAWYNDVYKPDDFMNSERYKFTLLVNEASQDLIKKYGLQGEFKDHESGDKAYTFRRDAQKIIKKKVVSFAPPTIYGPDGKVICEYLWGDMPTTSVNEDVAWSQFIPTGEQPQIGYGSSVILDICVYPTMKGVGNRLQSVKIIDLIEYVPQEVPEDVQTPGVSAPTKAPW